MPRIKHKLYLNPTEGVYNVIFSNTCPRPRPPAPTDQLCAPLPHPGGRVMHGRDAAGAATPVDIDIDIGIDIDIDISIYIYMDMDI
jgi:hypothetical protein